MREILFRGKRKDTGEWVEAFSILKCQFEGTWQFLFGACKNALMEVDEHYNIHSAISEEDFLYYSVHPETIGQFTGLTDKKGTKIFEGDILKFHKFKGEPDWLGFVRYDISMFVIEGEQPVDNGGFEVQLCSIDRKRCKIIGNIYDNPELLVATDDEETN